MLNRYHVGLLAYLLDKLQTTPDGDGTLLDHSHGAVRQRDGRRQPAQSLSAADHPRRRRVRAAQRRPSHPQHAEDTTMSNLLLAMLDKLDDPDREVRRQHRHAVDLTGGRNSIEASAPIAVSAALDFAFREFRPEFVDSIRARFLQRVTA